MRNKTPSSNGRSVGWPSTLGLVLLALVLAIQAGPAEAANRRFLVILANPPKTFADNNGAPPAGLANPAVINTQYFDNNPWNDIYSFAEWWEEVSYGSVTVTGETIGWVNLPWPIEPPPDPDGDGPLSPADYISLDFDPDYAYGAGEPFAEDPMPPHGRCLDRLCDGIPVDWNGDGEDASFLGRPDDAYPSGEVPDPDECRCCSPSGGCGPFSVDTDDPPDGIDDSCNTPPDGDEVPNPPCATNTCCLPDECATGYSAVECTAAGGRYITATSPECIPWCTSCGWYPHLRSLGNRALGPNIPSLPLRDGVYTPGERFRDVNNDGRYSALFEPIVDADGDGECEWDFVEGNYTDFADYDGDTTPDIPEPFEDHLVRWDPTARNGAGDWVLVTDEYIRANYPYNPDWHLDVPESTDEILGELDHWIRGVWGYDSWGTGSCDPWVNTWLPSGFPVCDYYYQEMYRMRGLGDFDASGQFKGDAGAVEAWTNVDEMVWRAGNGIYDPPERFRDQWGDEEQDADTISPVSSKMQQVPDDGDPWTTATPPPGSGPGLDTEAWYDTFWWSRYGTLPPPWAKGNTGRNSPRMVEFDPRNPSPNVGPERLFEPPLECDTNGDCSHPAVECDTDDECAPGETCNPCEWWQTCNLEGYCGETCDLEGYCTGLWVGGRPNIGPGAQGDIEPDSAVGFYDGWVEHDDLASSKYHAFGDQRLGEVTSPFSDPADAEDLGGIAGLDAGSHVPTSTPSLVGDGTTAPAGPLAENVHGDTGLDGGNVLVLEWMTWRTDLPPTTDPEHANPMNEGWALGAAWDFDADVLGDRAYHRYAGPHSGMGPYVGGLRKGVGFRDFNLDGLIDQGEVRPAGSENYVADSLRGTPNDGSNSRYPFNRQRLIEDCVAVLDYEMDFDIWHDVNSLAAVTGEPPDPPDSPGLSGVVSGIVLLPPGAIPQDRHANVFPRKPNFYPIQTNDRDANWPSLHFKGNDNDEAAEATPLPATDGTPDNYYHNLWFHDLVAGLDRGAVSGGAGGASGSGGIRSQIRYAAHEYGHTWEHYPDLYDYARLLGLDSETYPIGLWGVMADGDVNTGYPVHPVADLKSPLYSDWVDPVDLRTILAPGVEQEVTIGDSELRTGNKDFYTYQNTLELPDQEVKLGERFYFWRAGFVEPFDTNLPGAGLLIMHKDAGHNPEAKPPQQQLDPYTWYIVQADGDYDLDGTGDAATAGDSGDPWPGFKGDDPLDPPTHPFGNYQWYYSTVPNNRWHGGGFSGMDIMNIIETATGTRVTFRWTPIEIPALSFTSPPGNMSGDIFEVSFLAYDQFAGTKFWFYYDDDLDVEYDGVLINEADPFKKDTPGILEPGTVPWDLKDEHGTPLPDGLYYLYARLVPLEGGEGWENAVSTPRASRSNTGTGTVEIIGDPNPNKVKLESWTLTCLDLSGQPWKVVGSLSGEQEEQALTEEPYTTDGDEVSFRINAGDKAFATYDQFVFVTTGLTPYAGPVNIEDGAVTDMPIARICDDCVSPLSGDPPLTVEFDGRGSDPNGARALTYEWYFGEGEGEAGGAQVTHTYERPGTYAVTLTVRDVDAEWKFDSAHVEIRVNNSAPKAVIVVVPKGPENEFPLTMQFFGDQSTDPEDLPLTYLWEFTGPFPEHNKTSDLMNPPEQTYYEDPDNPGPYEEDVVVRLQVTDLAGETDVAEYTFRPGNSKPVAKIKLVDKPTAYYAPAIVKVDGGSSYDPDGQRITYYKWDFDGDNVTDTEAKTASHTYDDPGTHTITLEVSDGIVTGDASIRVVVQPDRGENPKAIFTADPREGKAPLTVNFDAGESWDPQGQELDFFWDFGDGAQGGVKMMPHTYTEPDKYTVTLTVWDPDGNFDDASVKIDVLDPDAPGANLPPLASFNANPTAGPAPLTVQFQSTSTDPDGDPLTQNWDFGDAGDDDTASGTSASYTYRSPGTYEVTLRVGDAEGLVDEAKTTIRVTEGVNNPPEARVATHPSIIIAPAQVTFDATLSSDPDRDELTFTWEISSGGTPLGFADDLVGALLTVSFQNTVAECNAVAGPCLTPGSYTLVLTADDGQGGTADKETSFEVRGGAGGLMIDDGREPGAEVPQDRALTGSARFTSAGPCGIGVLTPMLLLGLTLSAWMVRRRRH